MELDKKRKRIIVNFKNTAEDIALYEELKKHSSISGYIKDVLKGILILNTTTNLNPIIKGKETKEEIDIEDVLGNI